MVSVTLLRLAVSLTCLTGAQAIIVSRFAAKHSSCKQSCSLSCAALPGTIDKLLAAGFVSDGTPLVSSNLYSVYYSAGSNPDAAQLYSTIPENAFGPTDNRTGAIHSSKGWNRTSVIADEGYGEQSDSDYAEDGGLPAFCRFGGQIQTSPNGSRALFEVWMPLPDSDSTDDDLTRVTLGGSSVALDATVPTDRLQVEATRAQSSFPAVCTSGWTKRLLFIVGGGLRGAVAYPELKQALARYRVAVAGTNMGHFSASNGTRWLPDNPEAWTDFGHRAVHLSTMVSQLSVKTFYGSDKLPVAKNRKERSSSDSGFFSYFRGCSTGGRAGMAEAQRYPKDFDGIMAGCPAFDYNNLGAYQIQVNSFLADKTGTSFIPKTAYPLINKAVLESCDAQDGVKDGVVSLPHECRPDFAKLLRCMRLSSTDAADKPIIKQRRAKQDDHEEIFDFPQSQSVDDVDHREAALSDTDEDPHDDSDIDSDSSSDDSDKRPAARCLTDAQIETLQNIYSDYYIDGKLIRQAVLPGSEFGWRVTGGVTGKTFAAAPAWFQYQVLGQKVWDRKAFKPFVQVTPEVIELGQIRDPGGTINFDPDLSSFFDSGGKMLHYHGLADQLVTSGVSPQYYDMVKARLGGQDISDRYRLFLVPGMLHCRGGTGPFNFGGAGQANLPGLRPLHDDAQHDMFLALIDWVEKGKAPDFIIGAAYKTKHGIAPTLSRHKTAFSNGVLNTRLLCPYPSQAKLKSSTECSHDEACAFECV